MNSTIQKRIEAIQSGETPKGYKRCPIGVVPVDWQDFAFSDLFTVYCNYTDDLTTYPLYSLTLEEGITPKTERYERSHLVKKENAFKVMRINDFAFNPMNVRFGAIARYKNGVNPISVSGYYDIFSIVNEDDLLFMENFITCSPMLNYYTLLATGSLIEKKRFHFSQFMNLILPLPNQKERKKIGETLDQQDRIIDLKQRLIDEKRRQKKYLMQTLLTGRTRFPGFEGKWKTKTLGEIGSTYGGLTGKSSSDFGSGHPFIPYLNIYQNIIVDNNTYGYVSVLEGEKQNLVQYGDILVTTSSETPDEVGICSLYLGNQKKLFLNSFCFGFRLFDQDNINLVYLINYLRCGVVRNKLNKLAQGATRYNLSKNEFMKIQISLPPLPEQETIAEILSTADEELSLLERELEQEKLRKKALMQLLLTGLVRVEEL